MLAERCVFLGGTCDELLPENREFMIVLIS
jgi:hypothetical protein